MTFSKGRLPIFWSQVTQKYEKTDEIGIKHDILLGFVLKTRVSRFLKSKSAMQIKKHPQFGSKLSKKCFTIN